MDKKDCFAYNETKSKYQRCSALTICDCDGCRFYKPYAQCERERAESKIRAKKKGYYAKGFYEAH